MTQGYIELPNGHTNGHSNGLSNGDNAYLNNLSNGHSDSANGISSQHSSLNGPLEGCSHPGGLSDAEPTHVVEPVAIVGMAMRLPGGVHDAESFWDLLINKRDGQCRVPSDRYNIDAWYGPGKSGHVGTQYGYFLEDLNLANMDVNFWSMSKHEAELMDPQQRLLLEVVYECLENAGIKNWRGTNVGCYVGIFGEDWLDMESRDTQTPHMYRLTGYGDYITANRVSYEFDFKGPSMTIRTACSSSLTGLHEACQALYNGDCTSAIIGGTNIIMTPRMTIAMTEQGVISPTGSCKSFDADADGYARGEAVSALYIKKLSDAIRDGDPIRAVIRSTCVNNDGKTIGLTSPNTEAHEALIRRGHQLAGVSDVSQTAMIECHGTGTKIGDPVETKAVANVFGKHGIFIGSVKPNLGHSEGASGISSVMKMVLALEHKIIPPNINFKKPNPAIPWDEAKLKVPVNPLPWPSDRAERVGVNSFGIGGANAHVLLESAESYGVCRPNFPVESTYEDRPYLLPFSTKHPESLRRSVEGHESYLASHTEALNDMSYTLGMKRQPLSHRAFCIVQDGDPLEISRITKPEEIPSLIWTFTGQGAQWARMGQELILQEPSFAESIRKMDAVLSSLPEPPPWTLRDEIMKSRAKSRLLEAEFSQPCCTAIQIALVDLLTKWGVKPAGVVGHSSGEIGAGYAAKVITASEAILIAYNRGLATVGLGNIHRGGMAAVGLGRNEVTPYLRTGVIIGCENSPNSTTLTGDLEILEATMAAIQKDQPEVFVRALQVECAYHSHHMMSIEADYRALLGKSIHAEEPAVPFFSSVTGGLLQNGEILSTSYWVRNLTSPVLFSSAVAAALADMKSPTALLEIGPHSALAGPVRQIVRTNGKEAHYIATLVRNEDALRSLLKAAGELWINNVDVKFGAINPPGKFLADLPTYPWNYDGEYWHESRLSKEWRQRKFAHHDILGSRIIETSELDPVWRNVLRLENVPWIQDHDIAHDLLFPGAGYIAMIGEAIRQLCSAEDYTIRDVSFMTALIISEGKPVEIQTHLRKIRLTTSLDSEWYEFSISSLSEGSWTKHCIGQVKGACISEILPPTIGELPRRIPSGTWYRVMAKLGLSYGPRFRGLTEISAHVSERKAVAVLNDSLEAGETPYHLHPSTIDSSFQLFSCAAFHGVGRLFTKLSVPTFIEELYISPAKESIRVQAEGNSSKTGALTGNLVGVSEGRVVINLKGLQMSPLGDNNEGSGDEPHAAVELEWKSDINLADATQLMQPAKDISKCHQLIERLALACMIESNKAINFEINQAYLEKFRIWLNTRQVLAAQGQYTYVHDCTAIASMDSTQRIILIENLFAESVKTEAAAPAIAIYRIYKDIKGILSGDTEPLDILMEDEILTQVYDFMQLWEYAEMFELLGHYKPDMKILEIGAGTGGTTSTILPHLKSVYGERMFGSYKYTDVSAGFFVQAKERFKDYQGIEYAMLDISQDPISQGFEPNSFDLIIATNVLHATPNLRETLSNVHKLLHPHGRLFLQELDPSTKWINYVMGVLPGWWLGEKDGRPLEPYVSSDRWDKDLTDAGFDGIDSIAYDGHLLNNITARPQQEKKEKKITVLCRKEFGPITDRILRHLLDSCYDLDVCTIHQTPRTGQDILSLLDIESPFLFSATESDFAALKGFVSHVRDSGMLWLTGAAQIDCRDPNYSLTLGMARTIRNELGLDFATLELETFEGSAACEAITKVFNKFRHRIRDSDNDPIVEYAWSDGRVHIGRFHWIKMSEELKAPNQASQSRKLEIGRPGILQTLAWKQEEFTELKGDWVNVETRAVGLNFKDVLMSMGIVDLVGRGLGCERSGIVRKIGPDVKHLREGDRVLCCSDGSFSTSLATSELFCAKIPDALDFTEAATIPCVYGTVIYGLMDIARLSKGQTVLIHSAAGGVGIAAIQIARMIGAEIFCTVGNQDKIEFIMESFGIPRNRIFNSRDTSFLLDVLRKTDGKGVNVILNSLSGELLHASWKCVADFGTMVEIGKRDFIGHGTLSMNLFEQNRTFAGLDLSQICSERPHVIHDLLQRAIEFYKQGYIKPISPIKKFEAAQVEDAMRYMQKGLHIGKIVVTMPEDPLELEAASNTRELSLRSDVSYLFVGGLGGLGRSIASWLVDKGARNIIFFSRSAGRVTSGDPFVKELAAQGCSVQTISGSVLDLVDVRGGIRSANKPIAGVFQASMILNDAYFSDMSFEQWQAALLPKVQGTWNLHEALLTQETPLDFFVLFSSISGMFGQPGQANYAAGNSFLDAFVQYRHSLGLPASVLDIGAMEDVGYLSHNTGLLDTLKSTSMHTLHEKDLLDSLQLMIERSAPRKEFTASSQREFSSKARGWVNPSHVSIGVRSTLPISAPNNRILWKRDRRTAVYRNIESASSTGGSGSNSEGLKQFLRDCQGNPALLDLPESVTLLAKETGITLFGFMMRSEEDLDLSVPLGSLGVDSLVSIELRNWFRQKVGVEFTVLEVVNSGSLMALGEQTAGKLREKFQARAQ